ncbi:MAG TPA: polysaccharide biosynthesis C-terminal domain-containing protein, partial [Methanomassiliicoccaceae archaeon]|nr:polysaccharide biosynthesis C-terminal domain-containing protein [Methanomassiliicoccaceae archaeon]
ELLQIMALSTFPQAIYMIFQSVQRIKRDMRGLIIFGGASTVLLLILSQIFMGSFGLVGVGASWLLAYSIIAIPLLPALQRVVRDG